MKEVRVVIREEEGGISAKLDAEQDISSDPRQQSPAERVAVELFVLAEFVAKGYGPAFHVVAQTVETIAEARQAQAPKSNIIIPRLGLRGMKDNGR